MFEELAMDVYDEVDRRETDAGRFLVQEERSVLSAGTSSMQACSSCWRD